MLQLHPNCELCDRDLAPDCSEPRICSYECTFCADCLDGLLANVCPNCGGGFGPRPIRPSGEHRQGISLTCQPASTQRIHSPYSQAKIRSFAAKVKDIPAGRR